MSVDYFPYNFPSTMLYPFNLFELCASITVILNHASMIYAFRSGVQFSLSNMRIYRCSNWLEICCACAFTASILLEAGMVLAFVRCIAKYWFWEINANQSQQIRTPFQHVHDIVSSGLIHVAYGIPCQ